MSNLERKTYSYNGKDIFTYGGTIGFNDQMMYHDVKFLVDSLKKFDTDYYVEINTVKANPARSNFAIKNGNTNITEFQCMLQDL